MKIQDESMTPTAASAPPSGDGRRAVAAAPPRTVASRRRTGWSVSRLGPYWAVIAWLVAIVIFALLRPETFATGDNVKAILGEQSLLAIAALGVTVPLICGQFDLSIGATITLTGLLAAGMMANSHLPWTVAILVGVGLGLAVGAFNALLVCRFGVHSFIATLAVSTILGGLAVWYGKGQTIFEGISPTFVDVAQSTLLGLPLPVFYMLAIAIAIWLMLEHTPFGRYLYAIGSNRPAAEVAGVRVNRNTAIALIISAGLAGLVGVLLASRTASAQNGAGEPYLLPAFAAAFIGAATFRRGQFNVGGTLVGVYFVATLVSGAFMLGAANYVSALISGAALIIAVIGNRALGSRLR